MADHSLTACQSSTSFVSRAHHPESERPSANTNHALYSTHLICAPQPPDLSRLNENLSLCVPLPSYTAPCTPFCPLRPHSAHINTHSRKHPHSAPRRTRSFTSPTRIQRSTLDRRQYWTNTTKEETSHGKYPGTLQNLESMI